MTAPTNGSHIAFAGVQTVPVQSVHLDIQEQVRKSLAGVRPGDTMAVLSVHVKTGVNLAVAHKLNDHWDVVAWIGKNGWQKPLRDDVNGGVAITFSR